MVFALGIYSTRKLSRITFVLLGDLYLESVDCTSHVRLVWHVLLLGLTQIQA